MTPMSDMSVLITGGGSGIGEGTARYFARHGARVTICGRREEKLKAVADSIGPACAYVVADITNDADCARIIEAAVAHGSRAQARRESDAKSSPEARQGLRRCGNDRRLRQRRRRRRSAEPGPGDCAGRHGAERLEGHLIPVPVQPDVHQVVCVSPQIDDGGAEVVGDQ